MERMNKKWTELNNLICLNFNSQELQFVVEFFDGVFSTLFLLKILVNYTPAYMSRVYSVCTMSFRPSVRLSVHPPAS